MFIFEEKPADDYDNEFSCFFLLPFLCSFLRFVQWVSQPELTEFKFEIIFFSSKMFFFIKHNLNFTATAPAAAAKNRKQIKLIWHMLYRWTVTKHQTSSNNNNHHHYDHFVNGWLTKENLFQSTFSFNPVSGKYWNIGPKAIKRNRTWLTNSTMAISIPTLLWRRTERSTLAFIWCFIKNKRSLYRSKAKTSPTNEKCRGCGKVFGQNQKKRPE